ncbi:MAG: glutamine amidotransferase-related protein, partial [Allosphingosinicella sp.]
MSSCSGSRASLPIVVGQPLSGDLDAAALISEPVEEQPSTRRQARATLQSPGEEPGLSRPGEMFMKSAVAIRHVAFEDLGAFAPALAAAGFTVRYHDVGTQDLHALEPDKADLLVVLGGPIGAYEDTAYPFLKDEIDIIGRRLATGRPLIGICLGAQLIARAAGARVFP